MTSHEIKGQAFILRVIRAQEADVIVRLITSHGEKISAFAKAGLKSRKRFGGALEPMNNVQFRATKKTNQDLYYLEEVQVRHDFQKIKLDIDRLSAASYIVELTEHSSQEGLEHPEIYNLFGAALRALDGGLPSEGVARQFEVKLLAILGWLPNLNRCENCGAQGAILTLDPDSGHVACENCGAYSINVTDDVQNTVKHCLETSILKSDLDDQKARSVERLTTALLRSHWGSQTLKSTQFLTSLRRFQKH